MKQYRGIYTYVSIKANVSVNTAKKYILTPTDTQLSKRINKFAEAFKMGRDGKLSGTAECINHTVS